VISEQRGGKIWDETQLDTRLLILQLLYVINTVAFAVTLFGLTLALIRGGVALPWRSRNPAPSEQLDIA
jgi:hypothetical protein